MWLQATRVEESTENTGVVRTHCRKSRKINRIVLFT